MQPPTVTTEGTAYRHYLHAATGARLSFLRIITAEHRRLSVLASYRPTSGTNDSTAERQDKKIDVVAQLAQMNMKKRYRDVAARRHHCSYNASFLARAFEHRKLGGIAICRASDDKTDITRHLSLLLFGAVAVKSNALKNTSVCVCTLNSAPQFIAISVFSSIYEHFCAQVVQKQTKLFCIIFRVRLVRYT